MATAKPQDKRQLSEQAVRLGCGYPRIWKALTRGELQAEKCGGRWMVTDAAADAWDQRIRTTA